MKKNIFSGLAMLFFCGSLATVDAQIVEYSFIPSETQIYPLSAYLGSYVVLNGLSGNNVPYGTALAEWHFVTPQLTLTSANSFIAAYVSPGSAGLTWDTSTASITFDGGPEFYPFGATGPRVIPSFGAVDLNISYEVSPNNFATDNVFGSWTLVSAPEPATFALAGLGLATLLMFRRKVGAEKIR